MNRPTNKHMENTVLKLVARRVTAVGHFTKASLRCSVTEQNGALGLLAETLAVRVQAAVLCQSLGHRMTSVTFQVPKSWWQHFKKDCFPEWLKRRFPVRWTLREKVIPYEILAAYPQANIVVEKLGEPVRLIIPIEE